MHPHTHTPDTSLLLGLYRSKHRHESTEGRTHKRQIKREGRAAMERSALKQKTPHDLSAEIRYWWWTLLEGAVGRKGVRTAHKTQKQKLEAKEKSNKAHKSRCVCVYRCAWKLRLPARSRPAILARTLQVIADTGVVSVRHNILRFKAKITPHGNAYHGSGLWRCRGFCDSTTYILSQHRGCY